MPLVLPDLRGKIALSIEPLKAGFGEAKAEARNLDVSMGKALNQTMRVNTAPLESGLKAAQAEVAAAGAKMRQSLSLQPRIALGDVGGAQGINQQVERIVGGLRLGLGGGRANGLGAAGLALGGLEILGRRLDADAESAQKLVVAFQQDKISGEEMASQLLRSIPIAGAFGDAIARTFEAVTGETAYVANIKEATNLQEQHIKVVAALRKEMADFGRDMDRQFADAKAQIERLKLSGLPLKLFDIQRGENKQIEGIGDKGLNALNSQTIQDNRANVAAQLDLLQRLQRQLADTPETISSATGAGVGAGSAVQVANADFTSLKRQVDAAKAAVKAAQADLDSSLNDAQFKIDRNISEEKDVAQANRNKLIGGALSSFGTEFINRAVGQLDRQQKQIADAMKQAQRELAAAGGDKFSGQILDFERNNPAASQSQIDAFIGKINQVRVALKATMDDDSLAKLIQHATSPMEKFQDDIAELTGALSSFKISPGQFDEGLKNANQALNESLPPIPKQNDQLAELLRPGSSEAARLQFNIGRDSYQQQRDQVQQDILSENKAQTEILAKLPGGLTFTFMELP